MMNYYKELLAEASSYTPPPAINQNYLVVFFGESNSGGQALNTSATSEELSIKPELKIFDNINKDGFEDLHIGVNNLLGHAGMTASNQISYHGWELQLVNRVKDGSFGTGDVKLVKGGQGGSKINQWYTDSGQYGAIWAELQSRIDTALTFLDEGYKIIVFFSIGINDAGAGTVKATFKAELQGVISNFRNKYGSDVPFFATEIMTTGYAANYTEINNALKEVDSADVLFSTTYTDNLSLSVGPHWDYSGMKFICNDFIDKLLI